MESIIEKTYHFENDFFKSLPTFPAYRPRSRPRAGQAGFTLRARGPMGRRPKGGVIPLFL
ncbi:MAG: hypothetical protein A2V86_01545 [Deltaproteobacteria bacterium RBG_16_49_23]|nr:MAG: hypothetical protein A2V86_01545 [Deltaproteobacteria bacterium RBG_16_49_23]